LGGSTEINFKYSFLEKKGDKNDVILIKKKSIDFLVGVYTRST
jgi:hypothetical protein